MNMIDNYLAQSPPLVRAVVGLPVRDGRVLLGVRKKVSLGLGENLVAGIGGKVEAEETDDDALKREVLEEIGIKITQYQHRGRAKFLTPHKPKWNQDVALYVITGWEGQPVETEAMKPVWYPRDNLPLEQMWDDNSYWVPRILAGETIDLIFILDKNSKVAEQKDL